MRPRSRVRIMDVLTWSIMGIVSSTRALLHSCLLITINRGKDSMTRLYGRGSGNASWLKNPGVPIVCAQTSIPLQQMLITSIHTAVTVNYFSKVHSNLSVIHVTPRKLLKNLGGGVARMFVLWELRARWASIVKKIPNVKKSQKGESYAG